MDYTKSAFIRLDDVISEWARSANEHKAEILRRLCEFGSSGLVFHRRAFKQAGEPISGTLPVLRIASALFSTEAVIRADAKAALAEVRISADAVRDFCRVTQTRLPDAALGLESRGNWLNVMHIAPPCRDPDASEIEAAEKLLAARVRKGCERAERLRAASLSLSNYPALSARRQPSKTASSSAPAAPVPGSATERPAANAQPAKLKPMSEQAFEAWYREFARTRTDPRRPSDKEEREALEAAHPGKYVPRERFRAARKEFGPASWRRLGRPPASGNSADNSADNSAAN